jgi:predicted nucleic acid-binding protein
MTRLWSEKTGRLSFQVLNEFYVTVTDKLRPGMDPQGAREDVHLLLAWHPIPVDARVVEGALHIQDRYKLSWWDALIVSAAQVGDCRYLLTENLQGNRNMGNVKVINPFGTPRESI